MRVFVDECGAPGKNGQDYFVLGAVVFADPEDADRCSRAIDDFRRKSAKPTDFEFKSSKTPKVLQADLLKHLLAFPWQFGGFIHRKEGTKEAEQKILASSLKEWSIYHLVWGIEDHLRCAQFTIDDGIDTVRCNALFRRLKARHGARVDSLGTASSSTNNLVQMADLIAGAIKAEFFEKKHSHFRTIESRKIRIPCWNLV